MFEDVGVDSSFPMPVAFTEGFRGSFKDVAKLLSPLRYTHALCLLAGVNSNQLAPVSSNHLV